MTSNRGVLSVLFPITCFTGARSAPGVVNPLELLGPEFSSAKIIAVRSEDRTVGRLAVAERAWMEGTALRCHEVVTGSLRLPGEVDPRTPTLVSEWIRIAPGGTLRAKGSYALTTTAGGLLAVEYQKSLRPAQAPTRSVRALYARLKRERRTGWSLRVTISSGQRGRDVSYDGRSELEYLPS